MQHKRKFRKGSRMRIGEKIREEDRKERQGRQVEREKNVTCERKVEKGSRKRIGEKVREEDRKEGKEEK